MKRYKVKNLIMNIVSSIFIVLPMILIILFLYEISNVKYKVSVNSENIDDIKDYFKKNYVDIGDDVKEVILELRLAVNNYYIIYSNEKTEKVTLDNKDHGLSRYIFQKNEHKTREVLIVLFPLSLYISYYNITHINKETYYDNYK